MKRLINLGKNHPFITVLLTFIGILAGVVTPIYLGYLDGIRETAAWRKGIDKDIEYIKEDAEKYAQQVQELNSWKTSLETRGSQPSGEK